MSISTEPMSHPPGPPSHGGAAKFLIVALALALAVSTTAAIVLAVLYVRQASVTREGGGDTLVQKDKVSPNSSHTGIVYYPIPYAAPPNLKLTAPTRAYDIIKQDETGFTWSAHLLLEDFLDDKQAGADLSKKRGDPFFPSLSLKTNITYEDFTWEAKGLPVGKDAENTKIFPQEGVFNTAAGVEGEVVFPVSYKAPPNVELESSRFNDNSFAKVIVVESKAASFKWKNAGKDANQDSGVVKWKAKGVVGK